MVTTGGHCRDREPPLGVIGKGNADALDATHNWAICELPEATDAQLASDLLARRVMPGLGKCLVKSAPWPFMKLISSQFRADPFRADQPNDDPQVVLVL